MTKISKIIFCSLLITFIYSCNSAKKSYYFQGEIPQQNLQLHEKFDPTIKINDLLEIKLTASNDEAVKLLTGEIINNRSLINYNSGGVAKGGYLVDSKGEIELPFVGKFVVVKKKREQIETEITEKLSEYIQNPIVEIQIVNFKVTILGDVKNPGTYNIPNEKMTILELIGIAGDLNITGRRNDLQLIREENGVVKEYIIDLTKKDLLSQEYYFLIQNDIVYVKQNKAKVSNAYVSQLYFPILTGVSVFFNTLFILLR
jgi:polysaccharide export outer membrane protein